MVIGPNGSEDVPALSVALIYIFECRPTSLSSGVPTNVLEASSHLNQVGNPVTVIFAIVSPSRSSKAGTAE